MALSERDFAILEFEQTWWQFDATKDAAVLARFDCSPERYDQLLADILDDPEAESVAPLLVRRRNRLQARSREQRLANQRHQTGGAQ
jgi:hypothetical protein